MPQYLPSRIARLPRPPIGRRLTVVADWSCLLAVWHGVPRLPGALCRGHPWDDLPDAAAASICHRCPALYLCRAWADQQPENSLHGVIAGRRYTYVGHPSLRRRPDGLPVAL
jgi:hypothetical protein